MIFRISAKNQPGDKKPKVMEWTIKQWAKVDLDEFIEQVFQNARPTNENELKSALVNEVREEDRILDLLWDGGWIIDLAPHDPNTEHEVQVRLEPFGQFLSDL